MIWDVDNDFHKAGIVNAILLAIKLSFQLNYPITK